MNIKSRLQSIKSKIRMVLKEEKLRLVEKLLSDEFFLQQNPDFNRLLKFFPDFHSNALFYNRNAVIKNGLRDGNRILMAQLLLRHVSTLKTGDYAEIGVYQGNFARIIFSHLRNDTRLYCFDTFEGFSKEDKQKEYVASSIEVREGAFSDTNLNLVRRNILISNNKNTERLILVKGHFPSTYQGLESKRWRFIHIDCDLYQPAIDSLSIFWPRLVPGGVILCHDYNHGYAGIKKAVHEFFTPMGIVPVPLCDKAGSCVVIKEMNPERPKGNFEISDKGTDIGSQ